MVKPRPQIVALLSVGLAMPALAQQRNAPEPVHKAIQGLLADWQKRFNEHDAKGLARIYATDAVRVLPNGEIITGVTSIEKGLAEDVKAFSNASLTVGDLDAQGDVAWGYVHWTVMAKDENGAPKQLVGNTTNTWVHDGDSWKLVQEGVVYQAFPNPTSATSSK